MIIAIGYFFIGFLFSLLRIYWERKSYEDSLTLTIASLIVISFWPIIIPGWLLMKFYLWFYLKVREIEARRSFERNVENEKRMGCHSGMGMGKVHRLSNYSKADRRRRVIKTSKTKGHHLWQSVKNATRK